MKRRIFSILSLIVMIALLIALLTVATPCPVAPGEMPMRCVWSHRAIIGLSVLLIVTGVVKLFTKSQISMGIGIVESLAGVYGLAIMTVLIGTCMSPQMTCNADLFRPITLLFLVSYIILNTIAVVRYNRMSDQIDGVRKDIK